MPRYSLRTLLIIVTGICLFLGTLVTLSTWYGADVFWYYAGLNCYGLAMAALPVAGFIRRRVTADIVPLAVLILLCTAAFLLIVNLGAFGLLLDFYSNAGLYLTLLLLSGFVGLLMNLTFLAHIRHPSSQTSAMRVSDPDQPNAPSSE